MRVLPLDHIDDHPTANIARYQQMVNEQGWSIFFRDDGVCRKSVDRVGLGISPTG